MSAAITEIRAAQISAHGLRPDGADVINEFGLRTRGDAHMPAWYPGGLQAWIFCVELPWTDDARAVAGDGMDNAAARRAGDAAQPSWVDSFGGA